MGEIMAGGVSSRRIIDTSFAGTVLRINGNPIVDFSDSENPFEIADCEIADTIFTVNGKMTRVTRPSAIIMSVTVIFGSASHRTLSKMWKERFSNDGRATINNKPITADIVHPKANSICFSQGTMVSGPGFGGSVSASGKMNGVTYTFAFAKVT